MGNLDWMDEKTKERARMKLDHMDEVSLVRLLRGFPPKSKTFIGFDTNGYPSGSILPKDTLASQTIYLQYHSFATQHIYFISPCSKANTLEESEISMFDSIGKQKHRALTLHQKVQLSGLESFQAH